MNSYVLTIFITLVNSLIAQEIFETVEAVVEHTAELPCNITAEKENDRLSILAWYRNGSSTAFYSRDLRTTPRGKVSSPGGKYRLLEVEGGGINKLQIMSVAPSDAGVYQCQADFVASPALKTFVQLVIIEPTQRLWVIHENGSRLATSSQGSNTSRNIGPYYVGDTVHLFCVAFGGKPQSHISWRAEQRILNESSTVLSELRVRSDLTYGPLEREDHGSVLTCIAGNSELVLPVAVDLTINMYLPPELVAVRTASRLNEVGGAAVGRARAGEPFALQCRVLGARPSPPVHWRLAGRQLYNIEQNITIEPSQRLVVSDVELSLDSEHDESEATCCVPAYRRGGEKYVCAQGLPLAVTYPPKVNITAEEVIENRTITVVKGSDISFNCSWQANPQVYRLLWFHENDIISRGKDPDEVDPVLTLHEVSEKDGGEYACAATNDEDSTYSETVNLYVTYPAYCEDESTVEYGLAENESINITCQVRAEPPPEIYRWIITNDLINATTLKAERTHRTVETNDSTLLYQRPNDTANSTIFCWGINDVVNKNLPNTPCTFLVTDETIPRPPTDCSAVRNSEREDITVTCQKGHDGGLPQKFTFHVKSDTEEEMVSIISQEPKFIVQEPKLENFKFIIVASNDKGSSSKVEIDKESITDDNKDEEFTESAVSDITTLSLALCGGVALVALAACGLVLCAHERSSRDVSPTDPPLCAYNTEESNCETLHDSDEGSECNVRRTDSFRRAMARYPSQNYDIARASSFHCTHVRDAGVSCGSVGRHSAGCKLRSLQNISRRREVDAFCDHFDTHAPPDLTYVRKPITTFYTIPRKTRHKSGKELSDEASEITQTSDGYSLPPPPDEFTSYRAGTRIKDLPPKSTPTYTTIVKNSSLPTQHQYNVSSPMNTVGLPPPGPHIPFNADQEQSQHNNNPFEEDSS